MGGVTPAAPPCACGSPWTVRFGSGRATYRALVNGRVERLPCDVSRFLCNACGRTFGVRPPEAVHAEGLVRERAADLAFRLGRAAAAREIGLGYSVLSRLVEKWQDVHEPDASGLVADILVLERVRIREVDGILVTDADTENLVEMVPDVAALEAWLGRPGALPPLRVCSPLDPEIAAAVRRSLPGATLLVAPSSVGRAIRGCLAAGLGALRRSPSMGGRNAFPSTGRFLKVAEGAAVPGEGWPREVLGLAAAGRTAFEISRAPDAAAGAGLWAEFEMGAAVPGGAKLARMMAHWKAAILAGLDHRFVDRFARSVAALRRTLQNRRPALVFRDFRGYVLLGAYGAEPVPASGASHHGRSVSGIRAWLAAGT